MSDRVVTRVCVVAPSLRILGGQSVQALRLIEHLTRDGNVVVELLPVNPELPGLLGLLQRIKFVRTVVTSFAYVFLLLARLWRYDVIHVFSASYWSFVLAPLPAMVVGRLYGKGVLLNYHSGEAEEHLTRWPSAVRAMRLADAVVVPSSFLVEVFAKFGIHASAVYNGVELDHLPYRKRSSLRPRFLANRNLEPMYNVACVIRAFAQVQRERADATITVAGFGSESDKLKALAAELGLTGVTFVGRVSSREMGQLYDDADIFINASNIENMPLSIMDAFATGVPVVSTNAGGIPYMVRHGATGLLVEREDCAGLAAAALTLLGDADLTSRLSDEARRECVERYQWPVLCAEWVRLYQSLARS